jgi:hypothetical protein
LQNREECFLRDFDRPDLLHALLAFLLLLEQLALARHVAAVALGRDVAKRDLSRFLIQPSRPAARSRTVAPDLLAHAPDRRAPALPAWSMHDRQRVDLLTVARMRSLAQSLAWKPGTS